MTLPTLLVATLIFVLLWTGISILPLKTPPFPPFVKTALYLILIVASIVWLLPFLAHR